MAIGSGAKAFESYSVSIGLDTLSGALFASAFGGHTQASGTGSLAAGAYVSIDTLLHILRKIIACRI